MKEFSSALELVLFHTVSIPAFLSILVFTSVTAPVQGNLQARGTVPVSATLVPVSMGSMERLPWL